ncbi:hypothetical protein BpHYR1_012672 [Brachionus plicatilis]|uniref:Uncharacterized protein n=1 Tax=Brachionus plicatilis TaxID=10195 RepID=A0A3M7Q664_BRAPC|nr:hypothetical protein BpHYR1_012672 [Brachionus plicatilis]
MEISIESHFTGQEKSLKKSKTSQKYDNYSKSSLALKIKLSRKNKRDSPVVLSDYQKITRFSCCTPRFSYLIECCSPSGLGPFFNYN